MQDKYTITDVMPTGESHEMYGTEFHVKFAESEQPFKLWYKAAPAVGFVQEGTIDGSRFKKAKKDYTRPAEKPMVAKSIGKPAYKDNSDGQRQGMCINNAANYVAATELTLDSNEWAAMTHTYARALYTLGDLGQAIVTPQEKLNTAVQNVKDVFGPVQ